MFLPEHLPILGVFFSSILLVSFVLSAAKILNIFKERRRHALLAAVVDHYIHDHVNPDNKSFHKDTVRIAKKAWKHTAFATLQKNSPEPEFEPLLIGATNKCFKVSYWIKKDGVKTAFMRVQGAGSVLSNPREQELAIFQYASKHNLGPQLYAVFDNGYIAEFMTGTVVPVCSMSDPKIYRHIASLVGKWHTLKIPSTVAAKRLIPWKGRKPLRTMSLHANTWEMIGKWLSRAKRLYAAEDAVALCLGEQPTFHNFQQEVLSTQMDLLPYYAIPSAIVLCHNDLNHGNLLWDEEKQQLLAVDLEFSGINHRGFDLGNHFCEWAGLELHYENCPNNKQMRDWLSIYIDSTHPNGDYDVPREQLLDELVVESRKWMQASHLFWWLWGMIQIKISNIEGFDAVNYSKVRWAEYMKNKQETQALKHPDRLLENMPSFEKVFKSNHLSNHSSNHSSNHHHRRSRSRSRSMKTD